jgi:hypothetical protein
MGEYIIRDLKEYERINEYRQKSVSEITSDPNLLDDTNPRIIGGRYRQEMRRQDKSLVAVVSSENFSPVNISEHVDGYVLGSGKGSDSFKIQTIDDYYAAADEHYKRTPVKTSKAHRIKMGVKMLILGTIVYFSNGGPGMDAFNNFAENTRIQCACENSSKVQDSMTASKSYTYVDSEVCPQDNTKRQDVVRPAYR